MKLVDLFEGANRPVVLVDFQEAYQQSSRFSHAFGSVIQYLNKTRPLRCLAFYNCEDLTGETLQSVQSFYVEEGLDVEYVESIQFRDKYYAFFRTWMDSGVPESSIIAVIRYLVNNRIHSSEEIERDVLIQLITPQVFSDYESAITSDPIYVPDISIGELKSFSGCLIGGGGQHECLKELTILLNAFNIKYTLVKQWIY